MFHLNNLCTCIDWYIWWENWESCINEYIYNLEKQSEKLFIKIGKFLNKYNDTKKELAYKSVLKKIEEIKQTANSDLIIMLDHLKYLINNEIWNKNYDYY